VGGSAAFFDLDKTVIAKSSALAFSRPFYRDGLITRRDMIKGAYGKLLQRMGGSDEQGMARTRDYLAELCKGWRVEQVDQIVRETLEELINPYVYAEAAALIGEHRAAGRDVVLVSGSGDVMVKPIGEALGITDIIASRMVVHEGRYTGEIDFYAYGENKAVAMREIAEREGYDLAGCYAYSDSITDAPMLAAVGHGYAVNPDRALRRLAAEEGWGTLTFLRPVSLRARLRDGLHPTPRRTAVIVTVVAAVALVLVVRASIRRRRPTI